MERRPKAQAALFFRLSRLGKPTCQVEKMVVAAAGSLRMICRHYVAEAL